jgi:hypothetical protein
MNLQNVFLISILSLYTSPVVAQDIGSLPTEVREKLKADIAKNCISYIPAHLTTSEQKRMWSNYCICFADNAAKRASWNEITEHGNNGAAKPLTDKLDDSSYQACKAILGSD